MPFCFCCRADLVGECQGLSKVAIFKAAFQALDPIPLYDFPTGNQGQQLSNFICGERRFITPASSSFQFT